MATQRSMNDVRQIFDTALMVRRRNRIADRATRHDFLLHRVGDDLVERLAAIKRTFRVAVDVGSYHGVLGAKLLDVPGIETVISIEASERLLAAAPGQRVLADPEVLPLKDGEIDLVVSGLSLQLVNDLPGVLLQIRRVLRPDGLLLASMLGGQTLAELRQAFVEAEDEVAGGVSPRVAPFADVRDMGGLLQRAGFALPVVDSDTVTVTYADPLQLVRELRAMGASNMLVDRRRVPMTRGLLMRALEIYRDRYRLTNGRVRATFEVLTLTAWAPHESQQKPLRPGSATSRLADALGAHELGAGDNVDPKT